MADSLRISEIFYSLQGEARSVGIPTVFVRLTGCPLRCIYCDSEYAFYGGERMSLEQILQKVSGFQAKYICVTGGEPLAQPSVHNLLAVLCDKGYKVSLETSGAIDVGKVDPRVNTVMDLKTPASKEQSRNLYDNIAKLKPWDQVKFVICDRQDYEWARFKTDEYSLTERVSDVLFSPSYGELPADELASWILADKLNVRFQLQLHKQLWGNKAGV